MDYLQVLCSIRLILTEYSQEERTQQEKYSKIFTDSHRMLLTITKQGERPHPLLKLDYLYGRSHGTPQRTHRLQHHSDIFRLQTSLSLVHSPIMSILQSYLFSSSTMNISHIISMDKFIIFLSDAEIFDGLFSLLGVQSVLSPTFPYLSSLISDFGLIHFILIFLQYHKDLLIKNIRIMELNSKYISEISSI